MSGRFASVLVNSSSYTAKPRLRPLRAQSTALLTNAAVSYPWRWNVSANVSPPLSTSRPLANPIECRRG
jgi:hypothetical protein